MTCCASCCARRQSHIPSQACPKAPGGGADRSAAGKSTTEVRPGNLAKHKPGEKLE